MPFGATSPSSVAGGRQSPIRPHWRSGAEMLDTHFDQRGGTAAFSFHLEPGNQIGKRDDLLGQPARARSWTKYVVSRSASFTNDLLPGYRTVLLSTSCARRRPEPDRPSTRRWQQPFKPSRRKSAKTTPRKQDMNGPKTILL